MFEMADIAVRSYASSFGAARVKLLSLEFQCSRELIFEYEFSRNLKLIFRPPAQVREAALLEMADLAVRSYASAFAAALALFAVFSLAAFVGAHLAPAPGGRDDVSGAADDVADAEDGVTPAEVTTPMFLRQGVRMEEPVVVTPVNAGPGSPFGRYQAFVRHMIGQVSRPNEARSL